MTALSPSSAASSAPRDRWLPLARAACLVVLALVVGLTLFDIPFQWAHSQILCSGAGAACPSDQLSPADLAQFQQAGLSLGFVGSYQIALNTVTVLVFVIVGSVIFWRRSNDWFGIFTAIALAAAGFNLALGSPPPAIVAYYPALLFPIQLLNLMGQVTLSVFFYLFPDGHFVPRWFVWLVPLWIVYNVLSTFRPELLGNDWYGYLGILSIIFSLIYRYWRVSNTLQRQQTKWVVFGSIVAFAGIVCMIAFLPLLNPSSVPTVAATLIINSAWYVFLMLIPLSIGIAILRSHLWDIDILIRRTLIYAVLTAVLALVYLGAVVALQAVFTALTGQQRSEVVTVISTLVIAALFVPLRNRIQSVIDRRLYRRKYDAARTLAQFGAALRDEVDLDALSEHLLGAVDASMQPASATLWLAHAERAAVSRPAPDSQHGGRNE